MFVYLSAPSGNIAGCWCIIALLHERLLDVRVSLRSYKEGCWMFVYYSAPTGKVVRCSCIITLLRERLLYVRL